MQLPQSQIDEAVQVLINRLIFMRSVEDRGLENKFGLLNIEKDFKVGRLRKRIWDELLEQFKLFDKTYNSKLFARSILEEEIIFFDDDTLQKVIRILYYGTQDIQALYMFDEIPGDLLGSIYEQYLGTVLQETEKRVKLDSESDKRKKMGIYYTPSYIVDYIVKNTVGEYIKDKTIDEILEVNIIDPACGSGSFLTRSFQEVANVIEERLKKGEKSNKWKTFEHYENRLTLNQKATILENCIYGVDLDEKAVELAQLNLLLKLLEEETPETRRKILPNMKNNIKCGNSLIDDPKVAGDKAFNWHAQFPEAFGKGGFDVVVGNPPYVDYSKIKGTDYLNEKYYSTKVNGGVVKYNLFQLFIERSINLLKIKGLFGFINPNTYLSTDNALSLRKIILEETSLKKIIDVSRLKVFKEASTYPVITIFEKSKPNKNSIQIINLEDEKSFGTKFNFNEIDQEEFSKDNKLNFALSSNSDSQLIKKLETLKRLRDFKETFVWGSSITGFAKHKTNMPKKKDFYSPVIQTRDIKRYSINWTGEFIEKSIYSEKLINLFKKKKIVIARLTKRLQATIDEKSFFVGKSSILIPKDEKLFNVLLAILNSMLINFYYNNKFDTTHMSGGYLRFDIPYLENIPIHLPTHPQEKIIVSLVDAMLSLQKQLHEGKPSGNEKERLEQQIKNTDYEIDQEVYKLYGLTKEEIKIVEDSLR